MSFTKTGFSTGSFTGTTLEASVTTEGFLCGQKHKLSIQCVISNTDAVGTLAIQASNDGSNWVAVPFEDENGAIQTTLTVSSGTDVNHIFRLPEANEAQYRIVYTRTSGGSSNTLSATAVSKRSF